MNVRAAIQGSVLSSSSEAEPAVVGPTMQGPSLEWLERLERARAAQVRWARVGMSERLARVREWRALLATRALALAEASGAGRRRPARETLTAEVLPLAEAARFLERHAARLLAPRREG